MSTPLTARERLVAEPNFLPDTVWDGFAGDWAISDEAGPFSTDFSDDFANSGLVPTYGLRTRSPLHTAILLCLMSDRRADPSDIITDGSGDPRGWPGDGIFSDEAPLGSRLWLLNRRELTPDVADDAVLYAQEALQTLIDQGAVASFKITATPVYDEGRLELIVDAFRADGNRVADMNFWLMWKAADGRQQPLAP